MSSNETKASLSVLWKGEVPFGTYPGYRPCEILLRGFTTDDAHLLNVSLVKGWNHDRHTMAGILGGIEPETMPLLWQMVAYEPLRLAQLLRRSCKPHPQLARLARLLEESSLVDCR